MSRIFFNGEDLKATYNFVVQSINNPFNIEIPSVAIQGRDGEIYFEDLSRLDKRTITLTGKIYGNSHADVMSKILGLKNLIATAHNRGKLEVEYNDGSGTKTKYMYVQLAGEIWNTQPIGARAGFAAANLTIRFSAIDKPFWIVETSNNNIVVAPLTNLKYGGTWWKDLGWKLEPYTIVNLLGKYGDFETDSDGNGVADHWAFWDETSKSIVSGIIGSYAQQAITDNSGGSSTKYVQIRIGVPNILAGHTFFVSFYYKMADVNSNTRGVRFVFYNYKSDDSYLSSSVGEEERSSDWKRYYEILTTPAETDYIYAIIENPVAPGCTDDVTIDGAMIVDLTEMGELSPPLKEFFDDQVSKWEDLATTSNITAIDGRTQTGEDWLAELLPYVNGVASLGFTWEGI